MDLPKQNIANRIGRNGVTVFTEIVENKLGWLFRLNHLEDDFGIDGYIDIITSEGGLTGKSIAVQIKAGNSYFKHRTESGWKYYGEFRHLNYYLNHDIPVIIVIVDVDLKKAFWTLCDPNQTERTPSGWSIIIPFNKELGINSKPELEKNISPVIDYVSQLEDYWEQNKLLMSAGGIIFVVDKNDIITGNFQPILSAIERLTSNRELLFQHREKVDISVYGYDADPRELFEIKEVKNWVRQIFKSVNGLSFFLRNGEYAQFLKLIFFCQIEYNILENEDYTDFRGMKRKKVSYESAELLKVINQLFSDLNDFCETFDIDRKVNEEITNNIMNCLTGGAFGKGK